MVTLELTEQMLSVIASALGRGAYAEVAPVINEIQRQIAGQKSTSVSPSPVNGKANEATERKR